MTTPTPTAANGAPLNPTRKPLPLSASQESQVRELYYKRVRNKCADEVRGMHCTNVVNIQSVILTFTL
jgi:COX assembly protein 1